MKIIDSIFFFGLVVLLGKRTAAVRTRARGKDPDRRVRRGSRSRSLLGSEPVFGGAGGQGVALLDPGSESLSGGP